MLQYTCIIPSGGDILKNKYRLIVVLLGIFAITMLVSCSSSPDKKIANNLKSDPNIVDASVKIDEKIINITIQVKNDVSTEQATEIGKKHAKDIKDKNSDKAVAILIQKNGVDITAVGM